MFYGVKVGFMSDGSTSSSLLGLECFRFSGLGCLAGVVGGFDVADGRTFASLMLVMSRVQQDLLRRF